ncbi:hypothetical protein FN846DRAFT_959094 [Sphaerosporella brunnea]|uniref:DUF4484 domain-containing protein n=1 Tax=Sphaerosporella brunnea TaxID=1250544 RepID=A0A5J5ERD0_9PEZI|nr:hypothetical protein FN846DRAFT_959094 [Sphaerosporella brunnea]
MKPSLHLDLGPVAGDELPPLAALFLIRFDTKKGYTIEWQRCASGVNLDGVEFKSLPSGLHNLTEDLIYFVHGPYAGVSAFLHVDAGEQERGALMVSAGVLVPLSYGRLGRSWRHAEGLKELARKYTQDITTNQPFEEYYNAHKIRHPATTEEGLLDTPSVETLLSSSSSPKLHHHIRARSVSETGVLAPGQSLSQCHPALSLGELMHTFGPLVFPLYRAALIRKRILLLTHAPVEMACKFVYDLSILSNIPQSVTDLLPADSVRLKPLFNVGVHDIPMLEAEAKYRAGTATAEGEHGAWVACTTDEVLAMKTNLWDIIVRLPPPHSKNAKEKVWPTAEGSDGHPLKATQRDLRRYRALTRSLRARYHRKQALFHDDNDTGENGQLAIHAPGEIDEEVEEPNSIEDVCEKLTWREIAYSSFIWWASAGEQQRSDAEADDGRLLLDTHFAYTPTVPSEYAVRSGEYSDEEDQEPQATSSSSSSPEAARRRRRSITVRRRSTNLRQEGVGSEEMDIIAYFHRMTQRMFSVLAERIEESDAQEEEEQEEEERLVQGPVVVGLDDLERMGLDRYSDADRHSVAGIVGRWWGRRVEVEEVRWRCCGVECG